MADRYQLAGPGDPWSTGNQNFLQVWPNAWDLLRFHRGSQFIVGSFPKQRLGTVETTLKKTLDHAKLDEVVPVKSLKDNYTLRFRRHEVDPAPAVQIENDLMSWLGTPYGIGGATPHVLMDCSGSIIAGAAKVGITNLPHSAELQRVSGIIKPIPLSKVKPMDIGFGHYGPDPFRGNAPGVNHVWWVKEMRNGSCYSVIDAEPSDTTSPPNWPHEPDLGVGLRIRPCFGGYYCGLAIYSWGRIEQINGPA